MEPAEKRLRKDDGGVAVSHEHASTKNFSDVVPGDSFMLHNINFERTTDGTKCLCCSRVFSTRGIGEQQLTGHAVSCHKKKQVAAAAAALAGASDGAPRCIAEIVHLSADPTRFLPAVILTVRFLVTHKDSTCLECKTKLNVPGQHFRVKHVKSKHDARTVRFRHMRARLPRPRRTSLLA
jgi:hypothetical protein